MTVPEAPLYNMKTLTWYWGCKDHKEKYFLKYNKLDRTGQNIKEGSLVGNQNHNKSNKGFLFFLNTIKMKYLATLHPKGFGIQNKMLII